MTRGGFSGEIIRRHVVGAPEGSYMPVDVDFMLLHDPALALLLPDIRRYGENVWDKKKVLVTVDHFAPPSTVERANLVKDVLGFVHESGIAQCLVYQGICHQLLVEGPWLGPGMVVLGADSHTTTAGALGCLATGMGSTDILYTLLTGRTWLRAPEAVRVDLRGKLPGSVMGKDIILDLLGRYGEGGFLYNALEFYDTERSMDMDDRFAVCNMAVEAGAKNSLFIPDVVTEGFLRGREDPGDMKGVFSSVSPEYADTIDLDISRIGPKVALPHSPANVVDVKSAAGERIDQVFIGSCTGGRLRDIEGAARILEGQKIASGIRLLVGPASQAIYREAVERGYIREIIEAGGVILNPSCGPCGGIDKGILGKGEACLSTSNRNFQGRLGDPGCRVFLGSPLTAAAAALKGEIIDPREVC